MVNLQRVDPLTRVQQTVLFPLRPVRAQIVPEQPEPAGHINTLLYNGDSASKQRENQPLKKILPGLRALRLTDVPPKVRMLEK